MNPNPRLFVALLVFAAAPLARAQPTPLTTDEARALTHAALPADEPRPTPAVAGPVFTTDEARAAAGRSLPSPDAPALAFHMAPRTTDEARALAGAAIRAGWPSDPAKASDASPTGLRLKAQVAHP